MSGRTSRSCPSQSNCRRYSGHALSKDKCPNRMRANARKITAIQAMSMVSAAAMIGFPATAYAGGPPNPAPSPSPSPAPAGLPQFVNSSQNIACNLGSGGVVCEISNRAYTISTPPPPCAQHSAWGTASIWTITASRWTVITTQFTCRASQSSATGKRRPLEPSAAHPRATRSNAPTQVVATSSSSCRRIPTGWAR